MNYYSKDEFAAIAVDVDGTITKRPFERSPLDEAPQEGFIWFYKQMCTNHPDVLMVIHTSRYLTEDADYWSTRRYMERWGFTKLYFPKRDGKTFKNMEGEEYINRALFGANSKLPFSLCIDDRNVGCPMLENGELDWVKIYEAVEADMENCKRYWEKKENAGK